MLLRRIVSVWIIVSFTMTLVPAHSFAAPLSLPEPGAMVNLSPAFEPVLIKGIKVHPENPFQFDFIVDTGNTGLSVGDGPRAVPPDTGRAQGPAPTDLRQESQKLIKYFLASLTIPEKDLWVNLSPYEKDRMIADNLGSTQMGQDMLAQDYILKQLTASLIYPERDLGKAFWDKVYTKAQQLYGTTEIPVNTFNKVWIVADKADVFERGNVAYIVGAHLKVMLEEDYTALAKHQTPIRGHVAGTASASNVSPSTLPSKPTVEGESTPGQPLNASPNAHTLASQIVRDIILPSIEQEVNTGKNFAPLRQMFYSMILASWYKMALKDTILTQIYGNQSKVKVGINANDPTGKDKIFGQYLKAYKKGVFNYIKEDMDAVSKRPMPRKYFSGGLQIGTERVMRRNQPWNDKAMTGNIFQVSGGVNVEKADGAMTASADLGNVMSDEQARKEMEIAQIRREYEEALRGDLTDSRLEGLISRLDQIQVAGGLISYKDYLLQLMREKKVSLAEQIKTAGKNGAGDEVMTVQEAARAVIERLVTVEDMPRTFTIPESLAVDVRRIVAALGGFARYDERGVYYNLLQVLPSLEPEEFEFSWRHGDNTERFRITADRLTAMVDDIWQEDNKVAADFVQLIRGEVDAAMTADESDYDENGIWRHDVERRTQEMLAARDEAGRDTTAKTGGTMTASVQRDETDNDVIKAVRDTYSLLSNISVFKSGVKTALSSEGVRDIREAKIEELNMARRTGERIADLHDGGYSQARPGIYLDVDPVHIYVLADGFLLKIPSSATASQQPPAVDGAMAAADAIALHVGELQEIVKRGGVLDGAQMKWVTDMRTAVTGMRQSMRDEQDRLAGQYKSDLYAAKRAIADEQIKTFDELLQTMDLLLGSQNDAAMTVDDAIAKIKGKKILLVDDESWVFDSVRDLVQRHGVEAQITTSTSGEEALAAMEREPFDFVLSDVHMGPGMDGYGLMREIERRSLGKPAKMVWTGDIFKGDTKNRLLNNWQEFFIVIAKFLDRAEARDRAAVAETGKSPTGGIDLNRARMQMNVRKEGQGVQMQFDPAMIERIKREGFDGLEFKIDTIVPVTNLPMLLGLREDEQETHPQLAGV